MDAVTDTSLTPQSVSRRLHELYESHSCSICHAVLVAPVKLPCAHIFCSECIRLRLTKHSFCPHPHCLQPATSTDIIPLPQLDAALHPLRQAAATSPIISSSSATNNYLVQLSAKPHGAKALLINKLRQNGLPINGNVDALADRYNMFVLKWNANADAANPLAKPSIVDAVIKHENSVARHAKKKKNPTNSFSNSFFKKSKSSHLNNSIVDVINNGNGNNNDHDDLNQAEFVVEEGDDFDTLIRKTKMRMAHLKRQREQQQQQQSLIASPSHPARKRPRRESEEINQSHRLSRNNNDHNTNHIDVDLDEITAVAPHHSPYPPAPPPAPSSLQTRSSTSTPCALCSHVPARFTNKVVPNVITLDIAPRLSTTPSTPVESDKNNADVIYIDDDDDDDDSVTIAPSSPPPPPPPPPLQHVPESTMPSARRHRQSPRRNHPLVQTLFVSNPNPNPNPNPSSNTNAMRNASPMRTGAQSSDSTPTQTARKVMSMSSSLSTPPTPRQLQPSQQQQQQYNALFQPFRHNVASSTLTGAGAHTDSGHIPRPNFADVTSFQPNTTNPSPNNNLVNSRVFPSFQSQNSSNNNNSAGMSNNNNNNNNRIDSVTSSPTSAPNENVSTSKPQLTPEVLARIERNRLIAVERKKRFLERQRLSQMTSQSQNQSQAHGSQAPPPSQSQTPTRPTASMWMNQ